MFRPKSQPYQYQTLIENKNMISIVSNRIQDRLIPQKEVNRIKKKQPYSEADIINFKQSFLESKTIILKPETKIYRQKIRLSIPQLQEESIIMPREQTQQSDYQYQEYPLISYIEKLQIIKNLQSMTFYPSAPTQIEFTKTNNQQAIYINIIDLQEFTHWKEIMKLDTQGAIQQKLDNYLDQLSFIKLDHIYYLNLVIQENSLIIQSIYQCLITTNKDCSIIQKTFQSFAKKLLEDKLIQSVVQDKIIDSFILVWNHKTNQTWVLQQINSSPVTKLIDSQGDFKMNKQMVASAQTYTKSLYKHHFQQITLSQEELLNLRQHFKTQTISGEIKDNNYNLNLPIGVQNNQYSEQHNHHITHLRQVLKFLQHSKQQESRINEALMIREEQQLRPRSTMLKRRQKSAQSNKSLNKNNPLILQNLNFIQQQQFILLSKKENRQNDTINQKLARLQSSSSPKRYKINKQYFTPFQIKGQQMKMNDN